MIHDGIPVCLHIQADLYGTGARARVLSALLQTKQWVCYWLDVEASAGTAPCSLDPIVLLASGGDLPEHLRARKLFIVARSDRNSSGLRLEEIFSHYEKRPLLNEILHFLSEPQTGNGTLDHSPLTTAPWS